MIVDWGEMTAGVVDQWTFANPGFFRGNVNTAVAIVVATGVVCITFGTPLQAAITFGSGLQAEIALGQGEQADIAFGEGKCQ